MSATAPRRPSDPWNPLNACIRWRSNNIGPIDTRPGWMRCAAVVVPYRRGQEEENQRFSGVEARARGTVKRLPCISPMNDVDQVDATCLWSSELADVAVAWCPPLGFFSSRALPDLALKPSLECNLRDLCQHFLLHLLSPFLSSSSPRPTQAGQEFTCSSDPASLVDCLQVASVTLARSPFPSRFNPGAPLSTTSFLYSHRTLTFTRLLVKYVVHSSEPARQSRQIRCHPCCYDLRRARSLRHQGFSGGD
jgi:hypothetical protein